MFFHTTIDFTNIKTDAISLWMFYNNDSEISNVLRIISSLNHSYIVKSQMFYWHKYKWSSCFGSQCYINHDFLVKLNNNKGLTQLYIFDLNNI